MTRISRWSLILPALSLLILPTLVHKVRADEGDDDTTTTGSTTTDPATGGSVVGADLQWRLADTSWNRREYDDAASQLRTYAERNPDDGNVLEAWWRVYQIYRGARPDEAKRKETFEKLTAEATRWERKYQKSDVGRAAGSAAYRAQATEAELGRPAAIPLWQNVAKNYPGTGQEQQAYWTLAEWAREDKRYQDAITNYRAYRKVIGAQEMGAVAADREGWMWEALHDHAQAVAAYEAILTGPYNFGWGNVGWSSVEAAEHLKGLGEVKLAREMALHIIDKSPNDNGGWGQIHARAQNILGQGAKKLTIYPHMLFNYTSNHVNIEPNAKLTLQRDLPILLRLEYVSKADPFIGTISLTPKFEVGTEPDNMKKSEDGGKTTYVAQVEAPDAKGNVNGDWWYRFTDAPHQAPSPDDLVVSRKWENAGPGLGNAIIRVQSRARWHIWVTLLNTKSNVNNISGSILGQAGVQPNEINDNGQTFHWYDWYDLTQGMTLKIPVEVGGDINEYYPKLRFYHEGGSTYTGGSAAIAKQVKYPSPEFDLKLDSGTEFPYHFEYPSHVEVDMPEIKK